MKVAIVHNLYPPYARGGAEQVVFKTVQGLVAAGHQVVVITLGPTSEREQGENVVIYRLSPKNVFSYLDAHKHGVVARLWWHVLDMWNRDSATSIERILQEEKPDVVHTHNLMGIGFLVPRVIRALKLPHIHTVHDVQLVEPSGIILKARENSWRYRGFMTRLYAKIMRGLLSTPNVVISPSLFLLQFYERWGFFGSSKRVVLRNPVMLDVKNIIKKENSVFRFLYLGQIETHKGVLFLVKTFLKFLHENNVPCELHIVGTGSKMDELHQMIHNEGKIYVHGRLEHSELAEVFEMVDITIVPSLCYENSPTVIFESFSYKTPVLASNIEGIAELIKEGENGFTFIAGNENSLIEKLLWCVQHLGEMKKIGCIGREGIETLSRERYLERLLQLYLFEE
jgi:glycosyltransferase involved in cell wall biosynthesis